MVSTREKLVLASGSPRRRRLLETARFDVEVRIPDADETWPGGDPQSATIELARRKLARVGVVAGLAVAADTVVVLGQERLGKPRNAADAMKILQGLSGCEHNVVTGFCISRGNERRERAVTTRVWFRPLAEIEIEAYLQSNEPWDKAGAYGIQGIAGAFVDKIDGSYTNVVGLPLAEVIDAAGTLP